MLGCQGRLNAGTRIGPTGRRFSRHSFVRMFQNRFAKTIELVDVQIALGGRGNLPFRTSAESLFPLPYWYQGSRADQVFSQVSEYLRVIRETAGFFAYDPQTGIALANQLLRVEVPDIHAKRECCRMIPTGPQMPSQRCVFALRVGQKYQYPWSRMKFFRRSASSLAVLAALLGFGQMPAPPKSRHNASVKQYIHAAWDTLSRSMTDCASLADPKVKGTLHPALSARRTVPASPRRSAAGKV